MGQAHAGARIHCARAALPIGLAHHVKLTQAVKAGAPVRWSDVDVDETVDAVRIRREMEAMFRAELEAPRRAAE